MDQKEQKLIQNAAAVFMRYGIKSVNMDDLARHLAMSKKTLYQFVQDKEELVAKVLKCTIDMQSSDMKAICERGLNAIDEMFEMSRHVLDMLQKIHPSVMFDLQKYHPDTFVKFTELRHKTINECMSSNLKKGQREGLYRKDFNVEIVVLIYLSKTDLILNLDTLPRTNYSMPELYVELFKYHIRGIASEKGLEYLKEKMKTFKY